MKKAVRFFAVALAALMLLTTLAGCGEDYSDKIVLGGIGPVTGTASTYGTSVRNAMQIAIDEINANGGVNGVKLAMIFQDDEADGTKAKSAYETLMDKGMDILIGAVTSGASVALNDLTAKDGILQITPSASQIEAAQNPNSFRVCFTDPLQGIAMAEYAYQTLGYKKVAIIHNHDDDYSTGMYQAFVERYKELGGTISEDVSFSKDASDFSAQMTKIAASDAEFLYMPIYAEKAAQIVITANEKGVNLPLVGGDGLDGILEYLTGDNAKLVEGLIFLTPFVSTDEAANVKAFTETYTKKYGKAPDQFAADAYDAVYLAKLALEKAGVTSPDAINNAALIAAMTEIELDGLTGKMTFDANGEPQKGAKVAKIENGVYVAQ
ncbi:MAG: ABC transporter substrate-binding protein [Clostridiales bacterium]|nr:ABC transporter substrate-binding protein [Clostridiales bacterium]